MKREYVIDFVICFFFCTIFHVIAMTAIGDETLNNLFMFVGGSFSITFSKYARKKGWLK